MRCGALLLGLLLVPATAAAPTTLYAHMDGIQDFVLGPAAPPVRQHEDIGRGLTAASLTCLPAAPGQTLTERDGHRWHGFVATPTYRLDGRMMHGPERGIAYDLEMDTSAPAVFHWYLSTDRPTTAPGASLPVPLVVEVTIREGDELSVGHMAFDAGPVLATGTSAVVWTTPSTEALETRDVYHFEVPLTFHTERIDANASFNIRVDARLDETVCQEGKLAPHMAAHTSPAHRPRLEWTIGTTLHVQDAQLNTTGPGHSLAVRLQSAWGAADVATVRARLVGPAGEVVPEFVGRTPGYHGHSWPPEGDTFTWIARDLRGGPYTWHLNATNDAGTEAITLAISAKAPADAASPLAAPLAAVAVVAAALRRGQRPS